MHNSSSNKKLTSYFLHEMSVWNSDITRMRSLHLLYAIDRYPGDNYF